MKKELSPAMVAVALGVVAVLAVVIGYRMLGPKSFKPDTSGSEQTMKRVQETGKFYEPPAGAPVPGAPGYNPAPYGGMPAGAPTGPPGSGGTGYNMGGAPTGPPGSGGGPYNMGGAPPR